MFFPSQCTMCFQNKNLPQEGEENDCSHFLKLYLRAKLVSLGQIPRTKKKLFLKDKKLVEVCLLSLSFPETKIPHAQTIYSSNSRLFHFAIWKNKFRSQCAVINLIECANARRKRRFDLSFTAPLFCSSN